MQFLVQLFSYPTVAGDKVDKFINDHWNVIIRERLTGQTVGCLLQPTPVINK